MGESQVPMSEPKVLIIEADTARGHELESVLRFINHEPVLTTDCGDWNAGIRRCSGYSGGTGRVMQK